MPRSVNSVASRARRKKILSRTRGNFLSRKNVWTVAKNTYEKGLTYAYRDRKAKKREFRSLWIQRISVSTPLPVSTVSPIPSSWDAWPSRTSVSTAKSWPTLP